MAYEDVANNYESIVDHQNRIRELEKNISELRDAYDGLLQAIVRIDATLEEKVE